MSRVAVSHSFGADERSIWFPDLRSRLETLGHTVRVPRLPDPAAPRPKAWLAAFAEAAEAGPAEDTVLVGHSIGSVNVLRFLEQHDPEAHGIFAGAVLVAAPTRDLGYEALTEFFATPFDWARIRRAAGAFRVLTAVDDPVLAPDPLAHVRTLVTELGATATVAPTGGHFGQTPGEHIELPEAARLVLDCLAERR